MFEDYFDEFNPTVRKEILDNLQPEAGQEQLLEQVRVLFSLRYTLNKEGNYDDKFVAALMSFRFIAEKCGQMGKKKCVREIEKSMHILCLDRTDEFSPEILYAEMYQLIYLYMSSCMENQHFGSVIFGLGRMSEEKISYKIQEYLLIIRNLIRDYVNDNEGYRILIDAIQNSMNEKLEILETSSEKKSSRKAPRKIDKRS